MPSSLKEKKKRPLKSVRRCCFSFSNILVEARKHGTGQETRQTFQPNYRCYKTEGSFAYIDQITEISKDNQVVIYFNVDTAQINSEMLFC